MSDLKLQVLVGEMLLHEDPRKLQSLDDLHNIHLTFHLGKNLDLFRFLLLRFVYLR